MIHFSVDATVLLIWGLVAHFAADWLTQNEWIAINKMKRRKERRWNFASEKAEFGSRWWDRHPSLYVHGAFHFAFTLLVFPFWAAAAVAAIHMVIDTREPVIGWSRLIHQTQPDPDLPPAYLGIGQAVMIASDQVWHMLVIAIAALLVG